MVCCFENICLGVCRPNSVQLFKQKVNECERNKPAIAFSVLVHSTK
jgi:hypothetical protein